MTQETKWYDVEGSINKRVSEAYSNCKRKREESNAVLRLDRMTCELLESYDALKKENEELREKAWMYDKLCK